jgi:hypothetical protein
MKIPLRLKSIRSVLLVTILSLFLCSCATILLGKYQTLKVKSNPQGADVYVNGRYTGKQTPCKVEVKRRMPASDNNKRKELVLELKKEGYQDARQNDYAGINGMLVVDLGLGIWPGIVDVATGSHLRFHRNYYIPMVLAEDVKPPLKANTDQLAQAKFLTVDPTNDGAKKESRVDGASSLKKIQQSDVDINIPQNDYKNPNRFALIIGNEDYASHQPDLETEVNVKYAVNDAEAFRNYCQTALGVPSENIIFITNATMVDMMRGLTKINLFAKNLNGQGELFFYYAGHGLPHEETHEPYLLPVDISGSELNLAIKLADVYQKLNEYPCRNVTCFLDCCFSGGARCQQLLAVRGVKIKPKDILLSKNLVVFSASSGQQSAMAFDGKNHGLFTYYLLKKLQETSGKVTYGELAGYIRQNVALQAIRMNNKEQEPQLNISPDMESQWESLSFVK